MQSEVQYYWKNEFHDEWFPLPDLLQTELQKSGQNAFRFGIYLHQDANSVYGDMMTEYVVDPEQLTIWCSANTSEHHYLILKKIESDVEKIGTKPETFRSLKELEIKFCFRPDDLPGNPDIKKAEVIPADELKYTYFLVQDCEYVPYSASIQQLLNETEAPVRFAIYDREEWPELFGGSYREYVIDPKNLLQLSSVWKKVRPIARIRKVDDDQAREHFEVGSPNPADFPVSYELPQEYKNATADNIYRSRELNDGFQYNDIPNISTIFYCLYVCIMKCEDVTKYLDERMPDFQRSNARYDITGAILRPDPESPEIVVQYFEGPFKAVKRLKMNILRDEVLSKFVLLGEGFKNERTFENWTMKREASMLETIYILKEYRNTNRLWGKIKNALQAMEIETQEN